MDDDQPFLDAFAAVSEAQWSELWAALDALDGEPGYAEWAGGDVHDGVTQMPYPVYTPAVERLRAAIGATGLIVPYDWMGWDGIGRYRDPASLADAPVADAVRLIVAIVRSERFGDGNVEGALKSGLLQAALHRLRQAPARRPDDRATDGIHGASPSVPPSGHGRLDPTDPEDLT